MLSFVIPLYNEEESFLHFYDDLKSFLKDKKEHEIIFIDDGSTDSSLRMLKDIAQKDKTVRIFSFRSNQGKADALTLGFSKAKGDRIITLDADLQDKTSEIPKLLEKADEGYDVVSGWRKNRKDSVFKIISSKFFNTLVRIIWHLRLHDYNCGLKVYTKEAAKSLRLYGGMHRFIPLLAYQKGFTVCEVPIVHQERKYGKSKYSFSKLWKDLPDMFTMIFLSRYSKRPLHFFGAVGGFLLFVGFIILAYLTILHFLGYGIGDRPLLIFGMLLLLSGLQVFLTGFIADLMINVVGDNASSPNEFHLKYVSNP